MRAEAFYTLLNERERVRLRKEAGSPFPWTDDPILRQFKFTNVNRTHDRTTREFKKIYDVHGRSCRPEQALINCATYRYFGTIEMAQALGWQRRYDPEHVTRRAKWRWEMGQKVFTSAYIVTSGGRPGSKIEYVARCVLAEVATHASQLAALAEETRSWQLVAASLNQRQGFADFMTKEVLLDTFFCPAFWPDGCIDRDSWTPIGPGARRGLNRVMDRPVRQRVPMVQMLEEIQTLRSKQARYWKYVDQHTLSMHDVQFQLCEFDKYERARLGEGRPKALYKPS